MNLSKAKKIVILILIILNAVLLVLRINERPEYTLSSSREKAVYDVLGKNNIALYTDLLKDYSPMQSISVSSNEANIEKIIPAFFGTTNDVSITIEFSKTIYTDSYKTLTLGENTLVFEDNSDTDSKDSYTYNQAYNLASNFSEVVKAAMNFKNIALEKNSFSGNEYMFTFVEEYDGNKIFSNHIDITVKNGKVILTEASRYGIDGYRGEEQKIAAPDEAMLTMLYELKNQNLSYGFIITDMEIGYDFPSKGDIDVGDSLNLVPCYRVYVQGIAEPYTINAYTNEMM